MYRKPSESDYEEFIEEYLDEAQEQNTINEAIIHQPESEICQDQNGNAYCVKFANNYISYSVQCDKTEVPKQQPSKKFRLISTSNAHSRIENERILSQIEYLKSKTQFYAEEQQNIQRQRTLMLLQIKKIRLEIEELEKDVKFEY